MANPNINKQVNYVNKAFERAYSDINSKLIVALDYNRNPEFSVISLYMLYKWIDNRITELDSEIADFFPEAVRKALEIGFAEALLSQWTTENQHPKSLNMDNAIAHASKLLAPNYVATYSMTSMKDLLQATKNTDYSVKRLIQDTFSKHLTIKNLKNMNRVEMADKMIKELTGNKLKELIQKNTTAIVDKAGRRWNTAVYVDMAVTTKLHQAHVEGIKQYVQQNAGKGDLARIPFNPLTIDACKAFQGMIISMTGATAGYRTYDEMKATGLIFHPRCRHKPIPYYDEGAIPEHIMEEHDKISTKADKILENL